MKIKKLINELHEIKQQRQQIQQKEEELKVRHDELETKIKLVLDEMNEEYDALSEDEFQMMLSDLANTTMINVEVVYALPKKQTIKEILVPNGSTIEDSIKMSDILKEYPEIDISQQKVGIYGIIKPHTEVVHAGDRVEIYRPVSKSN